MTARTVAVLKVLSLIVLCATATAGQSSPDADQRALSALVERWTEARNANDAEAMRPLFAEKVDRVSLPQGNVESTTRDELLKFFAEGFRGSAKGTRAKSMKVRPVLLSDDTGVVDHTYTMFNADGSEIGVGHSTFIALKDGSGWKVVAVRYTSAWPTPRGN